MKCPECGRRILDIDKKATVEIRIEANLVDLKLDHNTKGTNAIQSIRDKNILSDALFYSSDGVDKIRSEMGMGIFEGVYFSSRDDILFENKAEQLIDKAVRRMEDIIQEEF